MDDPREQIYDERINPLMAEILKICAENNITFLASFQLSDGDHEKGPLLCTSCSDLPMGLDNMLAKIRRHALQIDRARRAS